MQNFKYHEKRVFLVQTTLIFKNFSDRINDTFILLKPGDNLHIRMSWENRYVNHCNFYKDSQYVFLLAHIQKNLTIIYL